MSPTIAHIADVPKSLDLELIAQRILKLAEISTLEHLEAMTRSQAGDLLEMAQYFDSTLFE